MMTELRMYGPRLKVMTKAKPAEVCLIIDAFDEETEESKIVTITMPMAQFVEWSKTFAKISGN